MTKENINSQRMNELLSSVFARTKEQIEISKKTPFILIGPSHKRGDMDVCLISSNSESAFVPEWVCELIESFLLPSAEAFSDYGAFVHIMEFQAQIFRRLRDKSLFAALCEDDNE